MRALVQEALSWERGERRGELGVNGIVVVAVLVVVGVVGLIFWALRYQASRLRHRYFRSVHMPRAQAEESLARHLTRLQQRYPDKSETWYLRRILDELRRDRR